MPMMDLLVPAGISLTPDFGPTLQCGVPTVQPGGGVDDPGYPGQEEH